MVGVDSSGHLSTFQANSLSTRTGNPFRPNRYLIRHEHGFLLVGARNRSLPHPEDHVMRAVGYFAPGPITAPDSLRDIELPRPSATGRDLLVEVRAVSVNPVDTKARATVPGAAPAVLIVGGAGGVGSIAIQLVRALTDLTVVATASRPETMAWVKELGAHHVIDHREPIAAEVAALG